MNLHHLAKNDADGLQSMLKGVAALGFALPLTTLGFLALSRVTAAVPSPSLALYLSAVVAGVVLVTASGVGRGLLRETRVQA